MTLTPATRLLITPHGDNESFEGTVAGLLRHWRRVDPSAVAALEHSLYQSGRIPPDSGDVRELSLEHNLHRLTTDDLERLEHGASISTLDG